MNMNINIFKTRKYICHMLLHHLKLPGTLALLQCSTYTLPMLVSCVHMIFGATEAEVVSRLPLLLEM